MKPIDIDQLSEAELVDQNHRIVERLRFLQQMRAHARMLEFSIGEESAFTRASTVWSKVCSHATIRRL
jgi:hypothetical protein